MDRFVLVHLSQHVEAGKDRSQGALELKLPVLEPGAYESET